MAASLWVWGFSWGRQGEAPRPCSDRVGRTASWPVQGVSRPGVQRFGERVKCGRFISGRGEES